MKDLYTFDASIKQALQTYQTVQQAYNAFFSELKIPHLTAEASSGEIGGNLSHEYHFPSKKGEDNLVCCSSCDYVVNEELAESRIARAHRHPKSSKNDVSVPQGRNSSSWKQCSPDPGQLEPGEHLGASIEPEIRDGETQWLGISHDRSTLVHASLPHEVEIRTATGKGYRKTEINPHTIKRVFPEIDLGAEDPLGLFKAGRNIGTAKEKTSRETRILRVIDMRYLLQQPPPNLSNPSSSPIGGIDAPIERRFAEADKMVDLVRIQTGDPCPNCDKGALKVESAVELGHTFNLGTRYSLPLEAMIDADPSQKDSPEETSSIPRQPVALSDRIPVQMGCHGIGVSRLIAAVADSLVDDTGLNWPRIIAPFEAVIISTKGSESGSTDVYDLLTTIHGDRSQGPIDAILDDRKRDFGWKIKDADMIGYPIIVILGRSWESSRGCEVQCRRLSVRKLVFADDLRAFLEELLQHL